MKHLLSILLIACVCVGSFAQTPYDSFAPETSRPMLELPGPESSPDTLFCAIVADLSNQTLLLVDVSSREIIATAPITDDLRKWLSVDPLSDKYPGISPYAYAAWNPIKYVDPDGRGPNDRVILARELAEQQIPYNLDNGYYLRTATSPEALATMDCSEFVCRVMAGDGITSTIESHSTRDMLANMMSDETKFIKSDIPQAGDIVLWAGHTGIIEGYNEKDNTVTVLHATRYKKKDGTIVSSTRRENYALNYYRGKNAFFYRPVNETPDVFEDSSTAKLQEIIVKPSKDDQNANY